MALKIRNIEPIKSLSDEELVERFAKTKQQAYFEELYNRYIHLAYGVCLKMMKNEADSKDVVSDVFKTLFLKLPTANVKSFKAYLYAVSRNECIAKLRKRKSQSIKMGEWQKTEISQNAFMENEGLLALSNDGPPMEKLVEDAVAELGNEQRTCVRLFFYDNKSYKEISSQTGFSEKQVKSYLQNGKRNLRIVLEKEMRKLSA
ncbi:MAG TPA: sigma-70 family RNA polymerase sigma factor [Bacteroidetes bacterium]|nr:sigma-70 family RNA polymerase sigma factor [Bacteroidota bacterium]